MEEKKKKYTFWKTETSVEVSCICGFRKEQLFSPLLLCFCEETRNRAK